MSPLERMHIFARVAEMASFTQAAQSMGLPKATASQAVQQLEAQLGVRLLQRTTRRVQLTPDGQAFYERCTDLLADLDDLTGMFRQEPAAIQGRLRVDLPLAFARQLVVPHLGEFLAAHPQLSLELGSSDRRVDLVREGYDCVLRVGAVADSSLVGRRLGYVRQINAASRAYVAARGLPESLDDLAGHALVHYSSVLGTRPGGFEYVDAASGETRFVAVGGALTVNNSDAYRAACLAGLGIVQSPEHGLRDLIASGEVVELLPQYRPAAMPVTLLYANRRHLARRVQVFMTWLEGLLQPWLAATP